MITTTCGRLLQWLVGRPFASACEVRIVPEVISLLNEVAANVALVDPNTCFREVRRFRCLMLNDVEGASHDADEFVGVRIGS